MSFEGPIIGIGGLSGAGKSAIVARLVNEFHYCHIDLDKLGHRALETKKNEIVSCFGNGILGNEGAIDRKILGSIVFGDQTKLSKLESIVHPAMRELAIEIIKAKEFPGYIIEGATLVKMDFAKVCDIVFWIHSPFLTRLRRIMARDHIERGRALQRLFAQGPLATQAKNASADIIRVVNASVFKTCRVILDILGCEYGTKKSSSRGRLISRICIGSRSLGNLAILSKPTTHQKTH